MRRSRYILLLGVFVLSACDSASVDTHPHPDQIEYLTETLQGDYEIMGRSAENVFYHGTANIEVQDHTLYIARTIDGVTTRTPARFDTITSDNIIVLRAKPVINGKPVHMTYDFHGTPGNNINLIGMSTYPLNESDMLLYSFPDLQYGREVLFNER